MAPVDSRLARPASVDAEVVPAAHLEDLDDELRRLTAASQELLASLGRSSGPDTPTTTESDDMVLLRMENEELRGRIVDLEKLFETSVAENQPWSERQQEYEALLEEKSEVIRALHQKIRDLQERPAPTPNTGEVAVPDELLQLKDQLDDQRRQLQEDEEAMVTQLREMEMSLSRDRAELARQRQEVQRLQADLAREIELASRDPGLRERLMALRRGNDTGKAPARPTSNGTPMPAIPTAGEKKASGLFKRFFK
jgi:chromosome segregation ATPase